MTDEDMSISKSVSSLVRPEDCAPELPPELFELPFQPQWLPGETIYSLAARYHTLSGNTQASSTCVQLFGNRRLGSQHDFPCRIDSFVSRSRGRLGDAESIIRDRTILPFFLPFRSEEDAAESVSALRGSYIGPLKMRLGIVSSRVRAHHPLRLCSKCCSEDKEAFGAAYWHRDLQLPGVYVCPSHNLPLSEAIVKANGVGRFLWYSPQSSDIAYRTYDTGDGGASRTFVNLARASVSLCSHDSAPTNFDPAVVARTYHERARARGWVKGHGSLRMAEIGESLWSEFRATAGVAELSRLLSSPRVAGETAARLLRQPRGGAHPLRHIVLIVWLFGDWRAFTDAYRVQSASVPCEKVEIASFAPRIDARVPHLLKLMKEDGRSATSAAAVVGIDTKTALVWAARAGIATGRRPKSLKPELRAKLRAMLAAGSNKVDAANACGVSLSLVTHFLRTEPGLHAEWTRQRTETARAAARATISDLVLAQPEAGIKVLRLQAPGPYQWLYRNDRAWLRARTRDVPIQRGGNHASVDWQARDRTLAAKVIAWRLSQPHRPRRVQLAYQAIPELRPLAGHLARLPLTAAALERALSRRTNASSARDLLS